MDINVDFLISGCNTQCKHCYVNGGPGPQMGIEDALTCIEKLDATAQFLPPGAEFTLDHEPMNHPCLGRILNAAARTRHIRNYHHGMTTGIGLMGRRDKDAVIQAYFENGYTEFGITIHGAGAHHDEIVLRPGAYEKTIAAAEYFKGKGAGIGVSLMLNRFFVQDAAALNAMLSKLEPDHIWFVIPIFTPHQNMEAFEPYRADMEVLRSLARYLPQWNAPNILQKAERHTVGAVIAGLKSGMRLREKFQSPQHELYLTLHPDCKLYVGNTGVETELLCDLRFAEPEALAGRINALPANSDYTAFYDLDALPAENDLIAAMESLPQGNVYGDVESVLYRGLVELNTPTRILNGLWPAASRRMQEAVSARRE